ncbi:MAG TPA: 3-deoxy-8-phosphooctulonate synthase [bacterium]|nr:3-deoxy-8-phosphooctulonate synthase [bacterium]
MKNSSSPRDVTIGNLTIGEGRDPVLIAGPCVIENRDHTIAMASMIRDIAGEESFEFIFKSSFDKANRSSIRSFRGPGLSRGLDILQEVRERLSVPVLTDIHSIEQIAPAAGIVDVIQIPAFLCRQTDLYLEAGRYDCAVNVKKGQFMSPGSMRNVIEKAREAGITRLLLTERGTSFGYERLVVDFSGLIEIRKMGAPIIFDATHSVQLPSAGGDHTAGNREYVPGLCRAAAAVGVHGFFMEVHDCPDCAPCDGPNMITPETLKSTLRTIRRIQQVIKDECL